MTAAADRHRFPYKALTAKAGPDWATRHMLALNHYSAGTATPDETVILDLANAIDSLLTLDTDGALDGYGRPNVTVPLIGAFQHRLNYDLGRLDGGTLSGWISGLAERHGLTEVL